MLEKNLILKASLDPKIRKKVYTYSTLSEALEASIDIQDLGNRFCKQNQDYDFNLELGLGEKAYYLTLTITKN